MWAEDTLAILEKGYYLNEKGGQIDIYGQQKDAQKGTLVYSPSQGDEVISNRTPAHFESTQIAVTGESTIEAILRLIAEGNKDVLALNFASAKNPGGGFLGGSQAQEESLARSTGLYPTLLKGSPYYEENRKSKSCFYTDYMIYSPHVPIIKDDNNRYLEELTLASFITAPAVNTGVIRHRTRGRLGEIEEVMKRRIAKVLALAELHGHSTIVLGAWGCGVFQNDPEDIARYFYEVIHKDFGLSFKKIVFAIYANNDRFITPFKNYFEGDKL